MENSALRRLSRTLTGSPGPSQMQSLKPTSLRANCRGMFSSETQSFHFRRSEISRRLVGVLCLFLLFTSLTPHFHDSHHGSHHDVYSSDGHAGASSGHHEPEHHSGALAHSDEAETLSDDAGHENHSTSLAAETVVCGLCRSLDESEEAAHFSAPHLARKDALRGQIGAPDDSRLARIRVRTNPARGPPTIS